MIGRCLPLRKLLGIALAAVWLVTLACADTALTPAMHCHGGQMPCCPRSGNHGAQCSPVQCADRSFQKSDVRDAAEAPAIDRAARAPSISQPSPSSACEFPRGLFFRAAVFRLKDDLRI